MFDVIYLIEHRNILLKEASCKKAAVAQRGSVTCPASHSCQVVEPIPGSVWCQGYNPDPTTFCLYKNSLESGFWGRPDASRKASVYPLLFEENNKLTFCEFKIKCIVCPPVVGVVGRRGGHPEGPAHELAGPSRKKLLGFAWYPPCFFIFTSEIDVLFRTRYLLWVCYHYFSVRGPRLRQTCPCMVAFSTRPSPACSQISVLLQLCWSWLWGFLGPCSSPLGTSGGAWRRRPWEGKWDDFCLLLSYLEVLFIFKNFLTTQVY